MSHLSYIVSGNIVAFHLKCAKARDRCAYCGFVHLKKKSVVYRVKVIHT